MMYRLLTLATYARITIEGRYLFDFRILWIARGLFQRAVCKKYYLVRFVGGWVEHWCNTCCQLSVRVHVDIAGYWFRCWVIVVKLD